jgi:hypothetical protein
LVFTLTDFSHVHERGGEPDGAVSAHSEQSDIVEKNYTSAAHRILRRDEQCSHDDIISARLADDCGAVVVKVGGESFRLVCYGASAEVGNAVDDYAGWFASRVGIYDVDRFH